LSDLSCAAALEAREVDLEFSRILDAVFISNGNVDAECWHNLQRLKNFSIQSTTKNNLPNVKCLFRFSLN
jgi:hypothetical protein